MKITEFIVALDKTDFRTTECVTGRVIVRTTNPNLGDVAKLFVKLYDKLHVEWEEHQMHTIYSTTFSTLKKPFELNIESFFDKSNSTVSEIKNGSATSFEFSYPFSFQLPETLQGSIQLKNATCSYFLKAYLATDENVSKHYQKGANVFEEFFKTLNHTYVKQEVKIFNKLVVDAPTHIQKYQSQSQHLRVTITLPKGVFYSDETLPVHICIEHAAPEDQSQLKLHKLAIKLFQCCKVYSENPYRKSNQFYYLVAHTSRKNLEENVKGKIIVEEFFLIPKDIVNTTSRKPNKLDSPESKEASDELTKPRFGIRVHYKLGFEFWKNFLIEDSEINVPVVINPEV